MQTIREAHAGTQLELAVPAAGTSARIRSWIRRPDVRAAFVATLALRLATSGFAVMVITMLRAVYVHAVGTMNETGAQLGIFVVPVPVDGPAAYVTGPWMRWDANYYYTIALHGYAHSGWSAFLPLYPVFIRIAVIFTLGHPVLAALLVSTAATFVAFVCLFQIIERLSGSAAVARFALAATCLLPIAFFLMAPYTEALFLALSMAAIVAALDKRWGRATLLAALASLTRQQGVLLGALALPDLWQLARSAWAERTVGAALADFWRRAWRPAALAAAPALVYGTWLLLLVYVAHQPTPTQLLTSTNGWKQHFTIPGFGVLVDVIAVIAVPGVVLLHHIDIALDALAAIIAAWGVVVARRRLPTGLLLYLLLCWCVAVFKVTPIGITNSASRYLLALLPLCIVPGMWLAKARPAVRLAWFSACGLLAAWVFLDWMMWAWVA
jgi:hypothetical protein